MRNETPHDFLASESEHDRIHLPPEPELGANEVKKSVPRATLNKKPIAQAVGLIAVGLIVVGGLVYLKISSREAPKDVDLGVVSPVANPVDTQMGGNNKLSFGSPVEPQLPLPTQTLVPPPTVPTGLQPNNEAELAAQAQAKAMLEARYKSSVMVTGDGSGLAPGAAQADGAQMPPALQAVFGAMASQQQGGGQTTQPQSSAAATQGGRFGGGVSQAPSASASYNSNRTLLIQQGKIIDAVLETAVKSDIPGMIIARVSEPVYGEQGRYELLPAGTRLFGEYSSVIKAGQSEIAAVWRRAITPDGVEVMLDSPSTNNLGIAGMGGKVNNHYFRIFGTAALLSVFGAASANVGVNSQDQNNSAAQYRTEVAGAFNETASNMLSKHADIPPTITVKHGTQIKVLVAKDLDFSSLLN